MQRVLLCIRSGPVRAGPGRSGSVTIRVRLRLRLLQDVKAGRPNVLAIPTAFSEAIIDCCRLIEITDDFPACT